MNKNAQHRVNDPKYVAEEISKIIRVIISKMSIESQNRARINLKNRIVRLNPHEMTQKETPAGASIGTSIALVKNILNGRDGHFIKLVIDELAKSLDFVPFSAESKAIFREEWKKVVGADGKPLFSSDAATATASAAK
jgi:hypothetical protein